MKHLRYLLMALAAITMVACHHDDGETIMELHTERFGGQKLAVQDSTAAWCEGDSVWINGGTYRITIDNNGRANVYVPTAASYNAVFPASIKLGGNRVCLPAEYEYATDDSGRQIINLPMAASSDGSNGLFFKHLTGAIIVKFINNRSETVVLDRITVHSANPLCGTFDIGDENILTPAGTTDTTVTIYFTKHEVLMAHSDTIAVLLPVAPVGGDNQFSVEVSCHVDGNRYTARNRQATPHAFQRNMLGYAYMTVEASTAANWLFEYSNLYLHIKTAQDFVLMQKAINNRWRSYSTMSYKIVNDIDMTGYEIEPISGYRGEKFDGDGHIINNLTIKSNTAYCALFDTINNQTKNVYNINLSNLYLISDGNETTRYISPLIGRLIYAKTINNCTTSVARIVTSSANIIYGGIVAFNSSAATITYCSTTTNCNISSANTLKFGGIIGDANADVTCTSCTINNRNVQLTSVNRMRVGGIIGAGNTYDHTFNDIYCYDTITVHTTTGRGDVGGLVGYQSDGADGNILGHNCTISGIITASTAGTNTIYVGKVYGYGRFSGRYGLSSSDYDASGLTLIAGNGNIRTGDPTGR